MRRRFVIIGLMVLVTACSRVAATPQPATKPLSSGRVTFAGSTTLQPLAHELGQIFQERHPGVEMDIAAGGSTVGIQAIHDGTVDIGMASRSLKPEEAEGIAQHQAAVDVIAMVVYKSNPVEDITLEQLRDIYLGQIANWSEVGGEDQPITVVVRGKNSGTRGAFDEIVLDGQEPSSPNLQTAVAASDVAAMVSEDRNAIGYLGFGHFELDIKVIAIDNVLPSEETAKDGSYPVVRPLLFLTGPLTQPLADTFVEFALSDEGQQIVAASGWVPAK